VAGVAATLFEMGCYEVSLGDTIGAGTPGKTRRMLDAVARRVPVDKLAGHYHDTYGQAVANIYASLEAGVACSTRGGRPRRLPYAPGASGNVATEDVVYMLDGLGIETGISLDALVDTAGWISERLGRPRPPRWPGRPGQARQGLPLPMSRSELSTGRLGALAGAFSDVFRRDGRLSGVAAPTPN
jgi:isopropylmalate/homocitrate/citramalate synthase